MLELDLYAYSPLFSDMLGAIEYPAFSSIYELFVVRRDKPIAGAA